MPKPTEVRLGRNEQRAVIALGQAQARLAQEAQATQEAISALAIRYGADFGFDADTGALYFEQRGERVLLIHAPHPADEATQDDVAEEAT